MLSDNERSPHCLRFLTPTRRLLVVADHLVDNKPQELLAEIRVELRVRRQRAQAGDLAFFAGEVGRRQVPFRLIGANRFGDAEPFRQHVNQRGVDVVDAGAVAGQDGIGGGRGVAHRSPASMTHCGRPMPALHLRLAPGRAMRRDDER